MSAEKYLVTFTDKPTLEAFMQTSAFQRFNSDDGGKNKVYRTFNLIPGFAAELTPEDLAELQSFTGGDKITQGDVITLGGKITLEPDGEVSTQ
ncbi:hypothetical protein K438DRAFT_2011692 [Mycena galopus ATCC 62051]|nr:hypothetical protein K438DRAFT_2011692 [Mycena galopus ATCC 62051]